MKEKIDFTKCTHYNGQPCPGFSNGSEARSSRTIIVIDENGKRKSVDYFDFIRDHDYKCSECPINNVA
jgi:hypothetical protein